MHIILALLWWIACACQLSAEEIDLPDGFVLENLFDEEIESHDLHYSAKDITEENEPSSAILEAHPSAIVASCVNAITGTFFDSQVDLVVPGPQPLIVQRTYCSSDKEWHFQHTPLLQVGPSRGVHHLNAGYQDDSGSGMVYRAHAKKNAGDIPNNSLLLSSKAFEHGLTNCCGEEISGQTNWKNSALFYVRSTEEKMYLLRHGSHVDRIFNRYKRMGKPHHKGSPWGKFHLLMEIHPNGNKLYYEYDDDYLVKVKATNCFGKILGELARSKTGTDWKSYCGHVHYTFDSKGEKLLSTDSSQVINATYQYNSQGGIYLKTHPQGRYLSIAYYDEGDYRGRVSQLLAPVGVDHMPIPTHTFTYHQNKHRGETCVQNAKGHFTLYQFDKEHKRLDTIVQLDEKKDIYSIDTFIWAPEGSPHEGNLMARFFQGDDKTYFCRKLQYDAFGNITREELHGNLTGKPSPPLIVDSFGETKGGEVYLKTFSSTQNGWNLPLEENDGRKRISYAYYPKSNRLKHRFTQTDKILKREFFEYDDNSTVIKEIWDDGIAYYPDDLTGVTERHLKLITPSTIAPIGFPTVIEERYLDIKTQTYPLLKKIVNIHSPEGRLIQQEHFGSDGESAYVLTWRYDHLGNVIMQTNALGQLTTYNYDGNGNKTFEKGPRTDCHKEFIYDRANRLIQEKEVWDNGTAFITTHHYNILNQRIATVDAYGNTTQYTYDVAGHLIETALPAIWDEYDQLIPSKKESHYDAMGHVLTQINPKGHCIKKQYTARGQPFYIEYPDGSTEKKEYTLDGLLERETAKNGTATQYQHDAFGRVIHTETRDAQNQLLKSTSATYNTFQLLTETDEKGVVTHYEYDGAGRRLSMQKGRHLTQYAYDSVGNRVKTIESIEGEQARIAIQEYDRLGRVIEERIEDETGHLFKKECSYYDATGNRTHHAIFTQTGPAVTLTEYTPHGKPKKITDALGHVTHFTYNYDYFHKGQEVLQTTKTDPLGNQEVAIHNPQGKVSCLMQYNPLGLLTQSETFIYDTLGQRIFSKTIVFTPKASHTITTAWEYDAMGNMIHSIEAKDTPEQKHTYISYNAYAQKEKIIKPDGVILNHEYDAIGRLKHLSSTDHTIDYVYTYDLQDHPIEVQDLIHNTATLRTYDEYGNLLSETLDTKHTLSYTYDTLNRPLTITLPDTSSIRYCYDANNLIGIERIKDNALAYVHRYTEYDLAENAIKEELIAQAGTITRQYDLLQRPTSLQAPYWHETIPPDGYDAVNNLLKREIQDAQGPLNYTYAYDDLYQLISETGVTSHTYQNDSIYNRIAKDDQLYTLNDLNQIIDTSYRYDANGNLIQKGSTKYRYDALDRLIEIRDQHLTTYNYDPFHRRTSKTHEGTTTHYLYQGQNEIAAIENNAIIQLRILGNSHGAEIGAAVALELHGITYPSIHDPQGNTVARLDTSGQLIENYRYTAFGEIQVFSTNAPLDNPWRYCSKRFDSESGLIYFGRRYYSPELGRWITPDPAGFADGPNLYAYVHNHPLAYVDPDGQFAFFLIPIAISLAADYCLPAATAYLQQYAGGAMAAGFLTGLVHGYNNDSLFEPSPFAGADLSTYLCERAGMFAGAALSVLPGKPVSTAVSTGGKHLLNNTVTREIISPVGNAIAKKGKQLWSYFSQSLARQTAPAIQPVAKNITKEYNAVKNIGQLTKEGLQHGKQNHKITLLEGRVSEWLGKDTKMVKNKAGDPIFLSEDALRRVRFDFNHTAPHNNPHGHIEQFINGKWNKSGPIYPIDVPNY